MVVQGTVNPLEVGRHDRLQYGMTVPESGTQSRAWGHASITPKTLQRRGAVLSLLLRVEKAISNPFDAVSQFVIPAKSRLAGCEPGSRMI
jgi:hypothetical protein